ncbi:MAG: HAMP domain-containing histidine kinase [Lachnospiraceae bacterium]|nr:HAMP domain-containing histidine kinase [Lachnospiraceae bacterium]
MKHLWKRFWYWMVLLFSTDVVFIFSVWLVRREVLVYLSLFFVLFTCLVLAAGIWLSWRCRQKDEAVLMHFLEQPQEQAREELLARFGSDGAVSQLCMQLLDGQSLVNEKTVELDEYRSYIEGWVHEAKTPLSLSTLVLNNHQEEMSPYVYARLHYIQHQLQEDVERILYYARLQAEHPDLRFGHVQLEECVQEAAEEYQVFLQENRILLTLELQPAEVVTDRKIVMFLLSQLLSNAVKYADSREGKVHLSVFERGELVFAQVCNNGQGVAPEDVPFLFDKGFTGSCPNRQKATGMGLYLTRKYAQKLCVEVRILEELPFESGFGVELVFRV